MLVLLKCHQMYLLLPFFFCKHERKSDLTSAPAHHTDSAGLYLA